jgi:uncharacterized protein YbjT (DUF2867 family)
MILITGASGTNGREILKQLAAIRVPVRAMVRDVSKSADLKGLASEVVAGDFAQPETLDAALAGVDKALMLPPISPDMVELQRNFIEAAKRSGTQLVVKFSALGADPNSPMRLGRWHGEGEKMLEESGIPYVLLRPNGFMQNFLAFAQLIANQGIFTQPGGDACISHVDVRDIAAVIVKTLTEPGHAGKTYTITGPEALSFNQVADIFSNVLGKPVNYIDLSPEDFKQGFLNWGQPEWLADTFNEMFALYRTGWGAEITDVVETVAHKPAISFSQFVQDHTQAFAAMQAV